MPDTTTKKIVRLLQSEHAPEARSAAALVLGEVGTRDAELAKVLCERLQDADPTLRLQVIKSVGKLRVEQALPRLMERIKEGGEEAEAAAQAAAHMGAKGTKALQDLMPKVAPGLRRYIAAALAVEGAGGAETAGLGVLLDRDPAIVEAAVRSLLTQVPSLDASHREALAAQLLHLLTDKKNPLAAASESAVVRLLIALGDPKAEAALWDRVLPPHPPEVRAAALAALGRWVSSPRKEQLERLLTCASDRDFRIAAPAWPLAKAQASFVKGYPADWRDTVFAQVCAHLEAVDRRAEPLLFLLREADPTELRDRLEKRALTLRKKEDYANALLYLRLL